MNTPIEKVAEETIDAILHLRQHGANQIVSPEHAYQALVGLINRMTERARQQQLPPQDLDDVRYATIALADELMLRNPGPLREYWVSRPLQLMFYSENTAGEVFFNRLQSVLSNPQRRHVLRVYATCLALGFRGKFAVRGGELQLDALMRTVREALGLGGPPSPISRRHERPREAQLAGAGRFPALAAAFLLFVFACGLVTVFKMTIDRRSDRLVSEINTLTSESKQP